MSQHYYIACDLGAESGRVMLGTLQDDRLSIEEIHRFSNQGTAVCGSQRWDVLRILDELKTGLRNAGRRSLPVSSISCDSWGVDYVLLQENEPMLTAPYHYRDARTDGGMERVFTHVSAEEIFAETGIQFMPLNTLYQLHEDVLRRPGILAAAGLFLNIADYFNYLFSGVARAEESIASTTQLYNPTTRGWSKGLAARLGIPNRIFPQIVPSGTVLGALLPELAAEAGLPGVQIVAGLSHDTGAAVAAVPAEGGGWGYVSSGTWSLLGVEAPEPIVTSKSREFNFTNEVGFGHSIRFLKNIVGLWIVQECRRAWANDGNEYTYAELVRMAEAAPPMRAFIDPADARFGRPDDMRSAIWEFCRETGQTPPSTPGEVVRSVLESLALLYRLTVEQLEEVTGRKLTTLHIVGGGSKNTLLNQLTADALGRRVIAGPAECTAIGNILVQAIALGHCSSLASARKVVRDSFPLVTHDPRREGRWDEAYRRLREWRSGKLK